MEHKHTVWAECRYFIYENSVRTSQETHYVSTTKTNRLMLFREIFAVYCENEVSRNKLFVLNQVVHIVTILH
jgi:hypothetical protein